MHNHNRVPRVFYWLKYSITGKYGILGPFNTESEANNKANEELTAASSWEVIPLNTRNKSAASSKLKAYILHETKDIAQAMQRIRRKAPSENKQPTNTNTEVHFI
jgi:hypothetical protein